MMQVVRELLSAVIYLSAAGFWVDGGVQWGFVDRECATQGSHGHQTAGGPH